MTEDERDTLRNSLRQDRQALTPEQQDAAAQALFDLIRKQDFFRNAQDIAFYKAVDGEIDPRLLLELALKEGKTCYLPVITEENPDLVSFAPYDESVSLSDNQWGIAEPPAQDAIVAPTNFEVVLVPLVGFDTNCFRLGMGKGFYDRTFSFKIFNRSSRPHLFGLAHECQFVEPFPTLSWDVRLDAVITAEKIYRPDTA